MYEELIVTGAWWDYVDAIAAHRIGPLLAKYPAAMRRLLRRWSRDDHLWKRRTAILAQLTFKERTDVRLLHACIEPNLGDTDFFIRKAIGWALRQHARTDRDGVAAYVNAHLSLMSGLSRREATKHLAPRSPLTVRRSPVCHRRGFTVARGACQGRSGASMGTAMRNDSRRTRAGKSLPCASTVGYAQAGDPHRRARV